MGKIAIAVNPASGRDIRRIVSFATVYDNREKQNIAERIVLAAYALGAREFLFMPESHGFAGRIREHLVKQERVLPEDVIHTATDMPYTETQEDTTAFAAYAEKNGADVLIVLGGDGTSRAAAKGLNDLPLIAVSTGTNNVFPEMTEGTVVGMAAAAMAGGCVTPQECTDRCKRLEILVNGVARDMALVDVVFSDQTYAGSKALWKREDIRVLAVTQCSPASIGFSALAGCADSIDRNEDAWMYATFGSEEANLLAPVAAGVMLPVHLKEIRRLQLHEEVTEIADEDGYLALDGEREVRIGRGDRVTLRADRNGPRRVDIKKSLCLAQKRGLFQTEGGSKHWKAQ